MPPKRDLDNGRAYANGMVKQWTMRRGIGDLGLSHQQILEPLCLSEVHKSPLLGWSTATAR